MINLSVSKISSPSYKKFYSWILTEWGKVDPYPNEDLRGELPLPILAFHKKTLVGGLQFSYYNNPEYDGNGIWINAVFVEPSQRGKGIASKLIGRAEKEMSNTSQHSLFVYTDKPRLYLKRGWVILKEESENFVLKLTVNNV